MKSNCEIFFSYAWGDESEQGESREKIVDELYESLKEDGFQVSRDKYSVDYTELFSDFMKRMSRADFIVVAISDKYLKSPYCMYELLEIYRKSNSEINEMRKKIFPIVLSDAKIHDALDRLEHIAYWKAKKEELEKKILELGLEYAAGSVEDFKIYKEITSNITILGKLMKDMNTLNLKILSVDNFDEIKKAIKKKVAEEIQTIQLIDHPRIYYNIPLRPNFFIGREKKLKEIHDNLINSDQRQNILLVSGVGGIGKTTLMQEYLHQPLCQSHFDRIITITVNKNLKSAFVFGTAEALQLDMKAYLKSDEQLQIVIHALKKCEGNNLFVIDNINESDKNDLVAMKDRFTATGWKFLIITRTMPDEFALVDVHELDINEALQLFNHHYSPETTSIQEAEPLLDHIHRHTLLTELLAKVSKKKGFTAAYLLKLLKDKDYKHPDLQRTISSGEHGKTTFRLSEGTLYNYILSLFEPENLEENAKTMVRFFSVLPADDIPIRDLKILWRVEKNEENSFEDRLDDLQQSGWITAKHKEREFGMLQNITYKMHPLVQEVVYDKLEPNIQNVRPIVTTITEIISQPMQHSKAFQGYAKSIIDKLAFLNLKSSSL